MSLAGLLTATGRAAIAPLMASVCTRYDAADGWSAAGSFACGYDEATPQTTGLTSFENGAAGYGINVFVPFDQALNSQDRLGVDGMTLEVQRVAVVGTVGGAKAAFCVKRGA